MPRYFAIKGNQAQELQPVSDQEMEIMFRKESWGMPQYYAEGAVFKVYPFPKGEVVFARSM